MATLTVTLPAVIKLANNKEEKVPFQPYHENFIVYVPAGKALEFEVETAGQFFYYKDQAATAGLVFTQEQAIEIATADLIVVDLPSIVTLTNTAAHPVSFVPYRENFTVEIGVSDAVALEAKTAGQVFAYLAQEQVNKDITVTFAAKQ